MVSIYRITNRASGKVYVGSTVNLRRRITTHRYMMRCGKHRNRYIQEDFYVYGIESFAFDAIESVADENRYEREQFWMDTYREGAQLYNILPLAGRAKGRVHFDETKRKMSISAKGRVMTDLQRKKQSLARKGKKATDETRSKMSASRRALEGWGSKSSSAKLTEKEAAEIIRRIQEGELQKDIAKIYGVSNSAISHVRNGTTWPHLDRRMSNITPRSTLTDNDVREIIIRSRGGDLGTKIAEDFGISTAAVYQIKNRKSWKHVEICEADAYAL